MNNIYIAVIGYVGSGRTTLANEISQKTSFPVIELDKSNNYNMIYQPNTIYVSSWVPHSSSQNDKTWTYIIDCGYCTPNTQLINDGVNFTYNWRYQECKDVLINIGLL